MYNDLWCDINRIMTSKCNFFEVSTFRKSVSKMTKKWIKIHRHVDKVDKSKKAVGFRL